MLWQANPDEEITDWRAVCGRTARTVRREGKARAFLYPIMQCSIWHWVMGSRLRGNDSASISTM